MKIKRYSILSTILLAIPSIGTSALLLEEQFLSGTTPASGEYTAGATVNGVNPAVTGFAPTSWDGSAVDNPTFGKLTSTSIGLTYSGLDTSGGAVTVDRSNTGGGFVEKSATRDLAAGIGTVSELWVSYLFNMNAAYDGTLKLGFLRSSGVDLNVTMRSDATNGDELSWAGGSGAGSTLSHVWNNDSTYMILIRSLGNGANDELDIWINPNLGTGEPSVGSGDISFIGGYRFNTGQELTSPLDLRISFGGVSGNQSLTFDELRYGTTFGDVAPIPEPSSIVLLVMGMALALRRRRTC